MSDLEDRGRERFGITDEDRQKLADILENGPTSKVEIECEACGDVFEVSPSQRDRRFCSASCAHESGFGGRTPSEPEVVR